MKRTIIFTILCILAATQAWAGADWPQTGITYRIKNIYGAAYLTMTDKDDASVKLTDEEQNSEYQFWEVVEDGSNYAFKNTGWSKQGKDIYLSCTTLAQGAPLAMSNTINEKCLYTLTECDFNNWDCFNIRPIGAPTFSLNSNMAATQFTLADRNASGSHWLFEPAVLLILEIVTMKSARSGKYINETTSGGLVQSSTVTETCKWIKYQTSDGYIFINNSTHKYIQAPQRNQQAVTGSEPVAFYGEESGGVWTFGYGGQYINERNSNDVCGWNQGMTDPGSRWALNKVGEISEAEVQAIMHGASPYLSEVKEGEYFRLYCEVLNQYIKDDYHNNRIGGKELDEDDVTQIWQAVAVGKESFYLQNVGTGQFIKAGKGESGRATGVQNNGTAFEPVINYAYSKVNNYFNFVIEGGLCLDLVGEGYVDNYYPGSKELSGAEWLLCRVDKVNEKTIEAEREAFAYFTANTDEYAKMLATASESNVILAEIFADKACSELTETAKAMSDDEFAARISSLPAMLKAMCLKLRNASWTLTKGGRNLEQFFRIADYHVYSNSESMHKVVGTTDIYNRLSNPTGITADAGDIIAVFVDKACPSGATLMLEVVESDERVNATYGETIALKQGMNLVQANKSCDLFVLYEINSAEDKPQNYLSNYPDIKVHIEGGKVNGNFDLTRGMTDAEWADMVESGMLMHGKVYLKGENAIGSWPSSILVPLNKTSISAIATFYDNIVKWDKEVMGINDEFMPGISQRFNNIYMAHGTEIDGYMYATSYGTFYSWSTLSTILSPNVLRNGGNQWGPSHEFGHNHQNLINMVGCTEVSNNFFANMVVYNMGASMSRGKALSNLSPNYVARNNWIELDIWCKTQMYWKLYQYFHLAGYDTAFFPKLFNILRRDGLKHENGKLVPASADYLRFAEACCEAAGADLTDFFQMYGFFDLIATSDEHDGVKCKKVDDYSIYYLYVTQDMIDATLTRCRAYEKKITNIGFIDDRIRQTPATYPGAAEGTMRTALNGGGSNDIGTEGSVGMFLDFRAENYKQADGYTAATVSLQPVGSNKALVVKINNDGEGAIGFKVMTADGQLLYFYNDFSFTVPTDVYKRTPYTKDNIAIIAADAQGRDYVIYKGKDYDETDGIAKVNANTTHDIYDLQGRRVSKPQRGLYITNKRVYIAR